MIWDIPLRDGSYACGRVLCVGGKLSCGRFDFWGGLLHWHDSTQPTIDAIAGAPILWQGDFDVRSLASCGSQMLDLLPLESDGFVIPPILTTLVNGDVMIGYDERRRATNTEFRTLPVKKVGEDNESFQRIAEEVFLDGKPMRWERSEDYNGLLDSIGMRTPADLKRVEGELSREWRAGQRSSAPKSGRFKLEAQR